MIGEKKLKEYYDNWLDDGNTLRPHVPEIVKEYLYLLKVYVAAQEVENDICFTVGTKSNDSIPRHLMARVEGLRKALSAVSAQIGDKNV